MIRVERAVLPDGLRAVAYRDHRGNLVVCVSEDLDSGSQRAAVIEAIRAARRVGWRAGLPPAGIALFLAARALMQRVIRPLQARPAAWGTAAAATATAAAVSAYFLVTAPHPGHPDAGQQPGPSAVAPARPVRPGAGPGARPARQGASGRPGHSGLAAPVPASFGPEPSPPPGTTQPGQAPAGHGPPPAPSPVPSPQPTPSPPPPPPPPADGKLCIRLLVAVICLRL